MVFFLFILLLHTNDMVQAKAWNDRRSGFLRIDVHSKAKKSIYKSKETESKLGNVPRL